MSKIDSDKVLSREALISYIIECVSGDCLAVEDVFTELIDDRIVLKMGDDQFIFDVDIYDEE